MASSNPGLPYPLTQGGVGYSVPDLTRHRGRVIYDNKGEKTVVQRSRSSVDHDNTIQIVGNRVHAQLVGLESREVIVGQFRSQPKVDHDVHARLFGFQLKAKSPASVRHRQALFPTFSFFLIKLPRFRASQVTLVCEAKGPSPTSAVEHCQN